MPSTSEEQLLLEFVNDARLNPLGNAKRYINSYTPTLTSSDPDIQNALTYFGVSGALLLQQLQALTPAEPLAWSDLLQSTATAHSQAMINAGLQSHQVPGEQDLGTRVLAAGYDWRLLGENIFAYASSNLYTHAAFMIDWGGSAATGGMQSPPGHRLNIMNPSFREIGIEIIASNANGLGPLVVTEDLGAGGSTAVFILGVAYNDTDQNAFYSIGEGVSDLSVSVPSASATSGSAGGYTLSTTATGPQTITLSGAGLAAPVHFAASLTSGHNYKIDVIGGHMLRTTISGTISGPVDVVQGLGMTGLSLTMSGEGAKTLIGTPGNDTLNGGGGFSTAVYNVASSAAVLTRNSFGDWTVSAGADGVDTLLNIERVPIF